MTGRARHLWFDLGWPVLAGLVAAVGLASAYLSLGPATVLVVFAMAAGTVAIVAISVLGDSGSPTVGAVLRPSLAAAVTLVVTMGLLVILGAAALLLVAAVLVSSAEAQSRLRRRLPAHPTERDETRRRFDEIVRRETAVHEDDDDR